MTVIGTGGMYMHHFAVSFDDPEEMPERMSELAKNFVVRPSAPGPFKSDITGGRFGSVALFDVSMTQAQVSSCDELGYFAVGLAGPVPIQSYVDGRVQAFDRKAAYCANARDQFDLRFPQNGRALALNVFQPKLDEYAIAMSGDVSEEPVVLPQRLPLESPAGRAFQRYLAFLRSEIQRDSPLLASDLVIEETEKALIGSLLLAADMWQDRIEETIPPKYLHRAVDFIMARLAEPLSIGDIASAAAVNARTLQRAFQKHYGHSVMTFVRRRRLERVNEQLLEADADAASVTELALANGFWHFGRFSAVYRERFGELPSETLLGSKNSR